MKPLSAGDAGRIGRYQVVASLGEGGMGRVLLGVASDGRLVAVKQVHPSFAHDDGFRSRFKREVEASRMVSGAYTAAVMDADPDAQIPWLASVYVPGPSLKETVDAIGPLPSESIHYLATGLATALEEIHRVGLIHRDLKPSNVLLTDDGPRVIDFGIARAAEGETDLTHTGSVIGSPGFMSPEQAEGKALTPASDVFSLGALLVMAATGNSPFAGNSTPQTLYNVVHSQPDLTTLPPHIRQLAEPCLAKDPAHRPTPSQLLDFLGAVTPSATPWPASVHQEIARQKGEVEVALGAPRPEPAPESKPKRTGLIVGIAAAAVVIVAAGVTTAIVASGGSGEPAAAPTSAAQPAAPPPSDPLRPDNLRTVDPCKLLDGKTLPSTGKLTGDNSLQVEYSQCSYGSGDNVALANIDVGDSASSSGKDATFEGLPGKLNDSDGSCRASVVNPVAEKMGISAFSSTTKGDRCKIVQEVLTETVKALRANPPRYPQDKGSLIPVDVCGTVSKDAIEKILGGVDENEVTGLHKCTWRGAKWISASVGDAVTERASYESQENVQIGGFKVWVTREDTATSHSCKLEWNHKPSRQGNSQKVTVSMSDSGDAKLPTEEICQKVKDFAGAMIPGLPKP
ncbi:serine/threonine protein kinase [Amycolatopsis sp. CA-230715]|uniref:serine/threonine protein kinase n=1 Tax=Amycolatopsis sp. CA-230715 TaxID=2745196 RepID=UPI001C01B1B3|nr:serine/threonine-protein kinase [Amycolatopsis sp. CA-230715]QWF80826.1 Serine/threonine-protein kinase PknD [Amycolatopsis sp. CA-230715]